MKCLLFIPLIQNNAGLSEKVSMYPQSTFLESETTQPAARARSHARESSISVQSSILIDSFKFFTCPCKVEPDKIYRPSQH
jgi:hypothetical protein